MNNEAASCLADFSLRARLEAVAVGFALPGGHDSEPLIRAMLAEHEIPVPAPEATESERFDFVARAFGNDKLGVNAFLKMLYRGLPEWHEQTEAQRTFVRLATELDLETTLAAKVQLASAMRKAARMANGADHEGATGS